MDRTLDQIDPIERSVLRICCAELMSRPDAPYKVVVNEALEISKDFGAEKGYRYINGIADKLAASLRATEYQRVHPDGNPQAENRSQDTQSVSAAVKARAGKVKISLKEKVPATDSPPGNRQKSAAGSPGKNRAGSTKGPGKSVASKDKTADKPAPSGTDKSTKESGKKG